MRARPQPQPSYRLGLRNPFAIALGEQAMKWGENGASATMNLGAVYEGPPNSVHGGVIALLLDQMFTEAAAAAGKLGMTAQLSVKYLRPTPLGAVHLTCWVHSVEGRKRMLQATFADSEGTITAEAEALLIMPREVEEASAVWPKRETR